MQVALAKGHSPALAGFGSSETTREIEFRITDYFDTNSDTTKAYGQYVWAGDQAFLFESVSSTSVRIISVDVYAFPAFNVTTNDAPVLVLTGLPVKTMSAAACSAQRTTMLLPSSAPQWYRVGGWKSSEVFADATVQPFTGSAKVPIVSWACLDPDTMAPYDADIKLQFKVVVRCAQTLPLATQISGVVAEADTNFWTSLSNSSVGSLDVVVEALSIRNSD